MALLLNSFLSLFDGKNPSNYNHFYDNVDKEGIIKKYTLLTYLDSKYKFLDDPEICIEWEFYLFKDFMNVPNYTISGAKFNKYLNEFNSRDLNRLRTEQTLEYICNIFESCLLGECINYKKYMSLCLFFGKKTLNKGIRRLIYDNLAHHEIAKSVITFPLEQTAALKLYCRFMILSGKIPDKNLYERLKEYKFEQIPLSTDVESSVYNTNRIYNKVVRQFNSISMDVSESVKFCNFIDKDYRHEFKIINGLLCKIMGDDLDYLMSLEEFTSDKQVQIVDKLTDNYETLVMHTYLHVDKLVIYISGEPYLTKQWDSEKKKYLVTLE
jgi:hypothetical protein